MEVYRYKAMNDGGRVVRGRVEATNPADLEVRLARLGLDLINFRASGSTQQRLRTSGVARIDLITFFIHLEHLVRAGVPILQALGDIRDSIENRRLREVTAAMIEAIEGGKTLSGSMAEFPSVFSPVLVSLIRAGEASGSLSEVLERIAENLKWQDEQVAQTKRLLMYPVFVAVVVIAVLIFLLMFVVPQMVGLLNNMGQELPWQTKALIATSNFVGHYWMWIFSLPVVAIIALVISIQKNDRMRRQADRLLLRLPVAGAITKKIILTRFSNYFAIMYAAGISVLDCIRAGEDIVGNLEVREAVYQAGRSIADGGGISASFARSGLFPPLVIRMLRVGENTGSLETALTNVAYFYTRDVRESIDKIQSMIVPVLTVALGMSLFWVIASVFGPLYDLLTTIDI
ncbi:MAG: type II secretion system F family protein [Gammaproteobacteria bacterium]|nr:type II secretion system F family protein [Gammaproteobacteria bacterium]